MKPPTGTSSRRRVPPERNDGRDRPTQRPVEGGGRLPGKRDKHLWKSVDDGSMSKAVTEGRHVPRADDRGRRDPSVGEGTWSACPEAARVIERITRSGFTAYLCGGCVRDLLLGRRPKDFDIVTSATPRQVKRLFRNSRIIGRRFRLVHVTFPDKVLEVSTFRSSIEPSDANELLIHQDNVFGTPSEDAFRRDFTVNGLFYDLAENRVIDFVGGLADLERRTIETIGDPWVRFREDPVRMLRAVKFASRLNFKLADDVYEALVDCRTELRLAAPPRLLEEILRLMNLGGARDAARLLFRTGLLEDLCPEVWRVVDGWARRGDRAAWDGWWNLLAAFDAAVTAGEPVSNPRLFAVFFAPLYEREIAEGSPRGSMVDVEDELSPVAARLRMARKDTSGVRQMFHAQKRFASKPGTRRRFSASMTARDWFEDAWFLFRLRAEAEGGSLREDAAWWAEALESDEMARRDHPGRDDA